MNEIVYATGRTVTGEWITWKRVVDGAISAHIIETADGTTANFGSHRQALEAWDLLTAVFPGVS